MCQWAVHTGWQSTGNPLASTVHPVSASTGRTVGSKGLHGPICLWVGAGHCGHRHWAMCQRHLSCGCHNLTTALFCLAGRHDGHFRLLSVPLQELYNIYDIVGYSSMKSLTCTHIRTCLTYVVVLLMVFFIEFCATIFQRRLCCWSRNLTTSMLWVPQPDDGCALGPGT